MTDIYAHMADAVMELINSKPQSPRKDELAHLLRDIVLKWDVSTDPHPAMAMLDAGTAPGYPGFIKPKDDDAIAYGARTDLVRFKDGPTEKMEVRWRDPAAFASWPDQAEFCPPTSVIVATVAGQEIRPGDSVRFNADGTVESIRASSLSSARTMLHANERGLQLVADNPARCPDWADGEHTFLKGKDGAMRCICGQTAQWK